MINADLIKDNPQMEILMRIYLAIPATSVSAEKAFLVLKRRKIGLRDSMEQIDYHLQVS